MKRRLDGANDSSQAWKREIFLPCILNVSRFFQGSLSQDINFWFLYWTALQAADSGEHRHPSIVFIAISVIHVLTPHYLFSNKLIGMLIALGNGCWTVISRISPAGDPGSTLTEARVNAAQLSVDHSGHPCLPSHFQQRQVSVLYLNIN